MIEQVKLAPCPFCEGPPCITARDFIAGGLVEIDRPQNEDEDEDYEAYVWCHECGAEGPRVDSCDLGISDHLYGLTVYDVMRVASERWNDRHNRSRGCYDGGEASGLNLFPRAEEVQALAPKELG